MAFIRLDRTASEPAWDPLSRPEHHAKLENGPAITGTFLVSIMLSSLFSTWLSTRCNVKPTICVPSSWPSHNLTVRYRRLLEISCFDVDPDAGSLKMQFPTISTPVNLFYSLVPRSTVFPSYHRHSALTACTLDSANSRRLMKDEPF